MTTHLIKTFLSDETPITMCDKKIEMWDKNHNYTMAIENVDCKECRRIVIKD